ncbi:MAG: divalent-cation tolerance protein CutA [Candidatus Micrarchaeota archaeon]
MPDGGSAMHVVYSSFASKKDARKFALALVKKKLAACASFHRIESVFFWKNKLCDENEWLLEAKTSRPRAAIEIIKKNHPYSLPMIYSVRANPAEKRYERWIRSKCRGRDSKGLSFPSGKRNPPERKGVLLALRARKQYRIIRNQRNPILHQT